MEASTDTGIALRSTRRGTRRRLPIFGAALLLLAAGAGAYAALHSSLGGGGGSPATGLTGHYRSQLGWSIRYPREMQVEHARASGRDYGVDETTFASFRSKPGVLHRVTPGEETIRELPPRARSGVFPSTGVALRIVHRWSHVPILPSAHPRSTRLPLRLSQFHEAGDGGFPGTEPRPLQHSLLAKGQAYEIQIWIGRKASTQQRALLDRMLASLSVAG